MLGQTMRGGRFGRPAAKSQRQEKLKNSRTKLPAEFAEFRLEDGQFLGEVLGEDFFEPEGIRESGRQLPEETRESLRDGNYQPAMFLRKDRERFSPPPEKPETIFDRVGVNTQPIAANGRPAQSDAIAPDAGMAAGTAGPNPASDIPAARARPARADHSPTDEDGNTSGFRTFDLPLTSDGKVDDEALVPGAVYRIPESAGGGSGRWTNGMFYNFDQKGDWNFRSAGDLDAYSGASDAPTPEERAEELDKIFLPAARLDAHGNETFRKKSGYGLARIDDGYTLTDPSGQELFDLTDEDAAELARQWNPEIAKQVQTIGLIWRKDLTPVEKRRLFADAIGADDSLEERIPSGRAYGRWVAKSPARALAHKRLKAFDALAEAMEREASDEEIGALLGEFHAAMLPEVLGPQRFVRELMLDIAPLLGNIRSVRHLQNDIAEVEEAIETGDWSDAALASGMAILDFVGILPGGNLVKEGGKLAGRGMVQGTPTAGRPLARMLPRKFRARWELAEFMANFRNNVPYSNATAKEYFAKVWDDLPPPMRTFLDERYKNFAGAAGENIVTRNLNEAGFTTGQQKRFVLSAGSGKTARIFDDATSEEIKEALYGLFVRPKKGSKGSGVEVKANNAKLPEHQGKADEFLTDPEDGELASVAYLRVPASRIEPEDLADVVAGWLESSRRKLSKDGKTVLTNSGEIPKMEIEELIKSLRGKTGPDGKPLDVGMVMIMAIGFALTAMYSGADASDTGHMSIEPNAA